MKHTQIIKKSFFGCLLFTLLFASACKKDKPATKNYLYGSWTEDASISNSTRSLLISKDSIHFVIWNFGNKASSQVTYIGGTYTTQDNKLLTDFKEIVVRENNDKVISRSAFTSKLFENATYELNNNKLKLNYTTYPADAPVATTIIFNRNLPD